MNFNLSFLLFACAFDVILISGSTSEITAKAKVLKVSPCVDKRFIG